MYVHIHPHSFYGFPLKMRPVSLQKRPIPPKKGPILAMVPWARRQCVALKSVLVCFAKQAYFSTKETSVSAKETSFSAKETSFSAKEASFSIRESYF